MTHILNTLCSNKKYDTYHNLDEKQHIIVVKHYRWWLLNFLNNSSFYRDPESFLQNSRGYFNVSIPTIQEYYENIIYKKFEKQYPLMTWLEFYNRLPDSKTPSELSNH